MHGVALVIAARASGLLSDEWQRVPVAAPTATGRIEGRVVEVDGAPAAEVFVVAVPLDRVGEPLGHVGRLLALRDVPPDPPRAVTDGAGRFAFEGLADEPQRLFLLPRGPWGRPRELTREPVRPGEELGDLAPGGAVLVVDVVGADGRPYPLAGDTFPLQGTEVPRRLEVASFPWCGAIGPRGELPRGRARRGPARVEHGRVWFDVEPGRAYRVGAAGVVSPPVHVRGPLTRLTVVSPNEVTTGDLALVVRDPEGRPYESDVQVQVRLVDEVPGSWRDGWVAARAKRHCGPWFRCALAPGRYRVRVTAHESWAYSCQEPPTPAPFRPAEGEVAIQAGEEARLDLRLAPRGR